MAHGKTHGPSEIGPHHGGERVAVDEHDAARTDLAVVRADPAHEPGRHPYEPCVHTEHQLQHVAHRGYVLTPMAAPQVDVRFDSELRMDSLQARVLLRRADQQLLAARYARHDAEHLDELGARAVDGDDHAVGSDSWSTE